MTQATPTTILNNLSRLASKPGVQATLILSKADGVIIQCTGLSYSAHQPVIAKDSNSVALEDSEPQPDPKRAVDDPTQYSGNQSLADKPAQDVAKMIFEFISGAGTMVEGLDTGNDIQLLRLRTRKNEIVIVPDSKYLLVVIHDQPKST